jgi:soluble lytic murein transglycosylase
MMRLNMLDERRRGPDLRWLLVLAVLLLVAGGAVYAWMQRDTLRAPVDLYRVAEAAAPARAGPLYEQLGEKLPEIKEYTALWVAVSAMPDLAAVRTLQDVIALRPQSPAAYEAHIALARYYAGSGAPQARDEYLAALALNEDEALRLELARRLEELGDDQGAYAQYVRLLNKLPDAFEGVRRSGHDPLVVAKDLIAASYDSDALDTLRISADPSALPLRAQALATLGRNAEAETAYRQWLAQNPSDVAAKSGLAGVLALDGHVDEALALYKTVDTADSRLAQADLLAQADPQAGPKLDEVLTLYKASPYPVAWWTATGILEKQGHITETLPLYARVAATDSAFADDAAYRLLILGQKLGDQKTQAQGQALLDGLGPNWLDLRARKAGPSLELAPAAAAAGQDILAKARALMVIGRADLAHLELVLAARNAAAPEVTLAMAQALAAAGDVSAAQEIAATYVGDHPYAPAEFWQLSYPQAYSATVRAAAKEFDVDPLLVWSVMRAESRYDPGALSGVGARGLMQVMPPTQDFIAEQLKENIPPGAAFIPETNIRMGAWYLHFLLQYFKGDQELAIAAYNGGQGSVDTWLKDPLVTSRDDLIRWIGYGQTREYLERVSLNYEMYQALYPGDAQ